MMFKYGLVAASTAVRDPPTVSPRVMVAFDYLRVAGSDGQPIFVYAYEMSSTPLALNGTVYDQSLEDPPSATPVAIYFDPDSVVAQLTPPIVSLRLDGVRNIHAYLVRTLTEQRRATIYSPLTPAEMATRAPTDVAIDAFVENIYLAQGYGQDYLWNLNRPKPVAT